MCNQRLLELFSGTKSVSTAVENMFSQVVSVDILNKYNPTHCVDINEWDYKQYPPNYFSHIWGSPPCTEYSILKQNTGMNTNVDTADQNVLKLFEIIDYFKPQKWFIENPQTGMLKDRAFMEGLPFYDVDYCRYTDWGYKKRTRIWTNVDYQNTLCLGEGKCDNMTGRFHKVSFGGQGRPKDHVYKSCPAGDTAYRVPAKLIQELFVL
jgi:site-specific DNA-cytosine methylase